MNNQNNVICERRTYTAISHTHSHSFAQLILPMQGELFVKTDSSDFILDEKQVFFLPSNFDHTFFSTDRNEFLVLDIPFAILPDNDVKAINKEICKSLDDRWQAIRFLMINEINGNANNNYALIELIRFASHYLFKETIPESIQFIHENYGEKINLEKLASLEHYNISYYCEWFLKRTGMTPYKYIQNFRLEKAKQFLRETNLSILEIAYLVGYEQQSSLTRLFQKYEGITPTVYRKNID